MGSQAGSEFRDYVAGSLPRMRHFAFLMCGDWHRAEDAVQIAYVKLYGAWRRIYHSGVDAYTRRIIVRTLVDQGRRSWFRRERAVGELPEHPHPEADSAERLTVLQALKRLPKRQRATVVLRYWEDLSVEQTAELMRCSSNTVKTHTARALRTLRDLLSEPITETDAEPAAEPERSYR